MAWFMIRMEGTGLKMEIDGELPVLIGLIKLKKVLKVTGIYTTRFVEAENADTAIDQVCSSIKIELGATFADARGSMENLILKGDSIQTVAPHDVDVNAKGFTFFNE
jgi:hypothetical protein